MAFNLEYTGTDAKGSSSARALASRVPGAIIDSSSSGHVGGPEWDAVWIRSERTAAELLVEVHPVDDEVVAAAREKWTNQLRSEPTSSEYRGTL